MSLTHLKMQQDIPILKQKCNAAMIDLCHRVRKHVQKFKKIINNLAGDCSISLKFRTVFE